MIEQKPGETYLEAQSRHARENQSKESKELRSFFDEKYSEWTTGLGNQRSCEAIDTQLLVQILVELKAMRNLLEARSE